MLSRWRRRLLLVALLAAVAVVVKLTLFRPQPIGVTVFAVDRGLVEASVTNSKAGTVKTRRRADLSPEVGGRVVELTVRAGDRVVAGQSLLRLADDELRAQIALLERAHEAARAGAREACTRASQADRELDRHVELRRQEIVSATVLEQLQLARDVARSACDAGRAREREAEAARTVAAVNLTKIELRAPFAGVVAEVTTEIGEWITPSPPGMLLPAVVQLLDPGAIYVSAPIDEVDLSRVAEGQAVRVTLDAYPERSLVGRVLRVSPYVLDREGQNRTFEIEVELDDRTFAQTLLPGASADVQVILETRADVPRIPTYALMEGGSVLVVRDGRLVEVAVEAGLRNWEFVEVKSGLAVGDAVVVSLDRSEVKAGVEVEVVAVAGR